MVTPATVVNADQAQPGLVVQPTASTPAPEAVIEPSTSTPAPTPTTPAPTAAPASVDPTQTPSEVQLLRQRLAEVESERQAQATEAELVREARGVQQEAIARGFSEEDALWVAQRHYQVARRVSQERMQLQAQHEYVRAKQTAASLIGKDHGIDPTLLMTGNSPEEMIAIAEREKRYAAQETRLKALEQRQVPGQVLNASNGSQAGNLVPTNDNIDKLWMDWEIAESRNPTGRANPYDAQYRKVLGR